MTDDELLELLRDLEVELHRPRVRASGERLRALLHESFVELGRSGRRYDLATVIAQLSSEDDGVEIWSQDFVLERIAADVALLTYRTAHRHDDGTLSRHTYRSSLWQRTAERWQMRFHQGTATEAFEPAER